MLILSNTSPWGKKPSGAAQAQVLSHTAESASATTHANIYDLATATIRVIDIGERVGSQRNVDYDQATRL
jgi:hypothetical protein